MVQNELYTVEIPPEDVTLEQIKEQWLFQQTVLSGKKEWSGLYGEQKGATVIYDQ